MPGNANSGNRKDRIFRAAILRQLEGAKLADVDRLAEELVRLAIHGESGTVKLQALREIADRTDGKVPQAIIGGDEDDPPLKHMVEIDAARSRFFDAIRKVATAGAPEGSDSEPKPE